LCGGVAANSHLRNRLRQRMPHLELHTCPGSLATDNAVGIALLGKDQLC
jgi:tRNA A37 threonylcarbamoyltransferase TsaD